MGGLGQGPRGWCYVCVHPVLNHVAPYQYLLPNLYLSVADIANPDLFATYRPFCKDASH